MTHPTSEPRASERLSALEASLAERARRERPRADARAVRAEALLQALPEALFAVGPDETLVHVDGAFEVLSGYTSHELLGSSVGILLDEVDPFHLRGSAALLGNGALRTLVRRDGRRLPVFWSGRIAADASLVEDRPLPGDGGLHVCLVRDARQHAEELESLRGELRRAFVLRDELHHRAANHLQVATSLLHLRGSSGPAEARGALLECARSIEALALVHERLAGAGALGRLDLDGYLTELAGSLADEVGVRLELELEPTSVDPAQVAPLGLALVELVANALEHARKPADDGRLRELELRIALTRAPGGRRRLTVADDGPGLPADAEQRGLGLTLVSRLARQVGGVARWRSSGGTVVELEFPLAAEGREHPDAGPGSSEVAA